MPSNLLPLSKTLQQRLDANSGLKDFLTAAENRIQAEPNSGFTSCGGLLEDLCRSGAFTELVNYELERLLRDPNYALEASSDIDMLVLRSRFFNLLLKIVAQPSQARLFGQASDLFLAPLMKSGVTIARYREPEPEQSAERVRRLRFEGNEMVAFGQSSYFKAGQDIFVIRGDAAFPTLVACFASAATLTTRWEYETATLARVRVVAADHSVSRLQLLASVLAQMKNPCAIPALEGLMEHPAHYVRWAALEAIFSLDRERGAALLKTAATDPHEHVRTAAIRSLEKLNAAAACGAPQVQ
jgi:HEAT repeat protein